MTSIWNCNQTDVAVQNEGSGDVTTVYEFEVTRAGFITDSIEDTTVDFQVTGYGEFGCGRLCRRCHPIGNRHLSPLVVQGRCPK